MFTEIIESHAASCHRLTVGPRALYVFLSENGASVLLLPEGLLARSCLPLGTAGGGAAHCCRAWQLASVPPGQNRQPGSHGAAPAWAIGHLGTWGWAEAGPGRGATDGQGRAVGNWRPALVSALGRGWWPQGIMKWGQVAQVEQH